ncbi:MAG: TonB-dependent receptor [Gemmatimonadota bacterium]|nr:TonB-dependent receptor [Gemmatimonadota bacterium]MDE2871893.1 TonB-dependent receptor [Gemmatimonadota bacterium]
MPFPNPLPVGATSPRDHDEERGTRVPFGGFHARFTLPASRPGIALAATLAALAPGIAAPPPTAAQDPTDLEGLVVTADRRAAPAWTVAAHTTVIEGDELRRAGIEYVADALRRVPGMAVARNGSFGAATTVHLRGGESDYVQVLIDGVPVNEPGGAFDFGSLTTDNIERIEIVRGPASAVYGSDAVSGVIQILTRRGSGPPGSSLSFHAGSFATRRLHGALAGGTDGLSYAFSLGRRDTDGIHEYDNSHRQTTLTGRVRGQGPDADATVSVRYEDRRFHSPINEYGHRLDHNTYYTAGELLTLSLNAGRRWGDALEARFTFNVNETDRGRGYYRDTVLSLKSARQDDIRRTSTGAQTIWRSRFGTVLAAGYELEHQSIRAFELSDAFNSIPHSENARRNHAAYTQFSWRRSGVALDGGVRMERNERFGAAVTWKAGAVWRSSSGRTRLRAAAGSGIKEPTFEQHYAYGWGNNGNPDLPPERSTSFEAGVDKELGGGARLSLTAFHQSYNKVIVRRYLYYSNDGKARSRGVEAVGVVDAGPVHLTGSYTLLDAGVPGPREWFLDPGLPLEPGKPLLRRPKHTAAATAIVRITEAAGLELGLRHTGERMDLPILRPRRRVMLPAHTVVDLAAEFQVAKARAGRPGFTLTVRAENLTGSEYEEAFGFAAPGRGVYVGGRMVVGGGG